MVRGASRSARRASSLVRARRAAREQRPGVVDFVRRRRIRVLGVEPVSAPLCRRPRRMATASCASRTGRAAEEAPPPPGCLIHRYTLGSDHRLDPAFLVPERQRPLDAVQRSSGCLQGRSKSLRTTNLPGRFHGGRTSSKARPVHMGLAHMFRLDGQGSAA